MNDQGYRMLDSSHNDGFNTLSCMKIFVIISVFIKSSLISTNILILLLTWNEKVRVPLRTFVFVHTILLMSETILFFLKHKDFVVRNRVPDFTENSNLNFIGSIVSAFTLFWYLTGLHWLQDCYTCSITNKMLYYMSCFIVYVGLIKMLAPLVALVLLVIVVSYLNPKIPEVDFDSRKFTENDCKCSICLEMYYEPTKLKILPCRHHFHSTCIDDWFEVEETCPLCMKHLNPFHEILDQTPI